MRFLQKEKVKGMILLFILIIKNVKKESIESTHVRQELI